MGLSLLDVVVARELTFCVRPNHSKQLHRMEVVHLSFNVRIRLTHSVQRKKKALRRVLLTRRAVGPNNAGGWPLKPEKAARGAVMAVVYRTNMRPCAQSETFRTEDWRVNHQGLHFAPSLVSYSLVYIGISL